MRGIAMLPVVIVLTTPNGQPVWIETEHVQTIRPDHGACHHHAKSVMQFESGHTLCVMEAPEDIIAQANKGK